MRPGGPCGPGPEQAGETRRPACAVAGDELDALVRGIGDEGVAHREQFVIAGINAVELAVVAYEGEQVREVGLGDALKLMGTFAHG